jgi:hypothetical protein
MNEHDFNPHGRPHERKLSRYFNDEIQYLLSGEEQLLQSLTARAPLAEVLNRICSALDRQIGNVVSHIALPEDDESDVAAIGMNAALFGLYAFRSEALVAENDEVLGSLEIYCCVLRSPSAEEMQWIERAKCLAAIAIQLDEEADRQGGCDMRQNQTPQRRVREWPVSLN